MKRLFISLIALALLVVPLSAFAQDDDTFTIEGFVTEDGSFFALLPDGWAADGNAVDGLTIANDEAILDAMEADEEGGPESGQFAMLVLPLPSGELAAMLGEEASFSDVLALVMQFMGDSEDMPAFGEIGELDAAISGAAAYGANDKFDAMMAAFDLAPGTYGILVLLAAPGELSEFEDTGLDVASGVSYSPALDTEYTTADGLVLSYPSNWIVVEDTGVVTITSEELDMESEDVILESGQYALSFLNLTALGLTGETLEDYADAVLAELLEEGDIPADPVRLILGDEEILVISVSHESDNEGGLILHDHDGTIYAGVYAGPNGEADLAGYMTANILLNLGE
ncbi:MAG: hypothetical protein H6673_07195 [Anaerolineales bacterium]|nr:hypothetical protein [Anaerolineales bacterium]